MNSRERVRAAISHKIPDYVPCGLGGCETAGLHVLAYDKLQSVLGISNSPPRVDTFMTNAVFEQDVLKAIEGDILLLASPRMCRASLWGEGYRNEWKEQILWGKTFKVPVKESFITNSDGSILWQTCNTVCPPGGYYFDSAAGTDLTADFEVPSPDSYNPPHDLPDALLRHLEKTAGKLYEETDYSLCLGETITDLQIAPGGMIGSMILMKQEPQIMMEFLQKSVDSALSQLKQLDQAVGKYVDILSIAHDFGDNRGVMIGADLWRQIYKPFYSQLFSGWRNITDMKINLHTCGSVYDILDDLIECGLQIFNPVQTSANKMSAAGLQEKFGDKLVFWGGGYNAQLIGKDESYESVYEKTCQTIDIFKRGGGYIFSGVHNLPAEIPAEHLRAMLDAWKSVRLY